MDEVRAPAKKRREKQEQSGPSAWNIQQGRGRHTGLANRPQQNFQECPGTSKPWGGVSCRARILKSGLTRKGARSPSRGGRNTGHPVDHGRRRKNM